MNRSGLEVCEKKDAAGGLVIKLSKGNSSGPSGSAWLKKE